jgi:hypothetical protein
MTNLHPLSILPFFRSCLSYYFLVEIELFLVELDFNF